MSLDNDFATQPLPLPAPPTAASNLKLQKTRHSMAEGTLAQSEASLPIRKSYPTAASLYSSTFSPPGSRSQSPAARPSSRATSGAGSVFGAGVNNALALVDGVAGSPGNPLDLVLKAFVPHIAVYSSDDTDALLKEKGFELGLWEILRPFGERVQGKVIIRDSNGSSRTYDDYSVHFVRFGEGIEHPEPPITGLKAAQPQPPPPRPSTNGESEKADGGAGRGTSWVGGNLEQVEAVVERHLNYAEESFSAGAAPLSPLAERNGMNVDTPSPYFALYLRRLLSGLPLIPHETFAHPVACVIAISSRNPAPIETLRRLYNETSTGDKKLPIWVNTEYLRYYVLVHDEERDDITKSMALFEQMKRNLGLHCHLLRIRGTQSAATDDDSIPLPKSQWMPASEELADISRSESQEEFDDMTRYIFDSDATAIRTFIREMVTQSILPTMERHVSVWNDQVASRRRGVAGRLMGLTRKWGFGAASRTSLGPGSGTNYDTNGFYRADAPEAIMRRLADYAFMLRDWKLAHSTYDLVRSDFHNDKAWKYHAATNEMAAISLLITPQNLSSKTRVETIDAMLDAALYSYLTRCTAPYGAFRCLVLGVELLRIRGGSSADDAARWAIRLLENRITGVVGDALVKERIAVCYASKMGIGTRLLGSRKRKSAMWSVLSAETWLLQSKYIQAQRCLNDARKTYEDLPTEHGIDKFDYASALMLSIGSQLNRQLEEAEEVAGSAAAGDDDDDAEAVVVVDEESEVLGGSRGRRNSSIMPGLPGTTATSLEAAPLRSQAVGEDEEKVDPGKPQDDFG